MLSYAVCSTGGGGSGMDRIEAGGRGLSNSFRLFMAGKTVIGVMSAVERDITAYT